MTFQKEGIPNNKVPASPKKQNSDERRYRGFHFHNVWDVHLHACTRTQRTQKGRLRVRANSLRIKRVHTRCNMHTNWLLRQLRQWRGSYFQYVFISCLVLHLMTGNVMFVLNTLIFRLVYRGKHNSAALGGFQNIFVMFPAHTHTITGGGVGGHECIEL